MNTKQTGEAAAIKLRLMISKGWVNPKEAAVRLYPNLKHPQLALRRTLAGEGGGFSAHQCRTIELIAENARWTTTLGSAAHVFRKGDTVATFNRETGVVTLDRPGAEPIEVITAQAATLKEIFAALDAAV